MSGTLERVLELASRGEVLISEHGYDELVADDILLSDIMAGLHTAVIIDDYPDYPKGSCVLVLQKDAIGNPIHVVWGIPRGATSPAVLVTGYRPDPLLWSEDFLRKMP